MEKTTRKYDKITLFNIHFNLNAYKNLSADEIDALSDTASNFFSFYSKFSEQAQTR